MGHSSTFEDFNLIFNLGNKSQRWELLGKRRHVKTGLWRHAGIGRHKVKVAGRDDVGGRFTEEEMKNLGARTLGGPTP